MPIAIVGAVAIGVARYAGSHAAAPVHYETSVVDRGNVSAKVTATGTLSALVTVSVGSQVSGRIETLRVDFGSSVVKGQIVATIEPSLLRAAVAQARANYAAGRAAVEKARAHQVQAERQFARSKELLAEGILSRSEYEAAEAAIGVANADRAAANASVAQAKAALDQAELNLHYATIVSPIEGIVISRNVDVGQTVAAALQAPTLFTIAEDLTHMEVDTNVAEADIGKIRAGMAVTFTVDAYPGKMFPGVVRQVRDNAQTIQNVVTYDAVIDVDNTERLLKPGMTASVTFVHATREAVLRVPNAALRFKPDPTTQAAMVPSSAPLASPAHPIRVTKSDERVVWVLHEGRALEATAHVGISDGTTTELLGGDLHEGDAVVVEATVDGSPSKRTP